MQRFKDGTEVGRNIFSLLRDLLLFSLLLVLVACPAVINDRLLQTGLTSVEGPGFKWQREAREAKQQSISAVNDAERAKQSAQSSLTQLEEIIRANPEIASEVAPLQASLKQTTSRLNAASEQLATAVSTQQEVLDEATRSAPISGWISTNPNIARVQGEARQGATVIVGQRPLRVRRAAGVQYPVVAILPPGAEVTIDELGPPPWARVTRR